MITCECGYPAPSLIFYALHRAWAHHDDPKDIAMTLHRQEENRKRHECAGCHQGIAPGLEIPVNVTSGKHIITVFAHEGHSESAYANTMERSDWKRSDSYLSN